MRILLLTNHFYPEEFRCNDIAMELAKRGHQVKVLTGIPDYPKGRFHEGYGLFKKRVERVNGVTIVRVPLIPRGKGGRTRMMLQYGSSLVMFLVYALYQAVFHKYDCLYIHNTSPAFICLPALLIKALRGTPIVHWCLDMWPESLVAGGIRNKRIYAMVEGMMRMIYRGCDKIQIGSLGFRALLKARGVPDEKIEYFPNWSDDAISVAKKKNVGALPKGFKIMFAGNLGEAQNLENVLEGARRLKNVDSEIKWIFLGDGRKKEWMESFITENSLNDTVYLLGRHPMDEMPSYFSKADVMLVSLCDYEVFNNTLPAKVQAYMSCSKPIVAFLNGEGQKIVDRAKCGLSAKADDIDGFVKCVKDLKARPKAKLEQLGYNGYEYYCQEFDKSMLMDRVERTIRECVESRTPPTKSPEVREQLETAAAQ